MTRSAGSRRADERGAEVPETVVPFDAFASSRRRAGYGVRSATLPEWLPQWRPGVRAKAPEFAPVAGDVDGILTREQVASWLQVRPRQVERLGVPCIALGRKTVRYFRSDVLEWLKAQRRATSEL